MLCCIILGHGGMINAGVYLKGKRGKVFWASIRCCFSDKCSSKQMWVLSLLVPLEPPIRASYMVPLGRESCISGVTPYCWGNGEGNSCV